MAAIMNNLEMSNVFESDVFIFPFFPVSVPPFVFFYSFSSLGDLATYQISSKKRQKTGERDS